MKEFCVTYRIAADIAADVRFWALSKASARIIFKEWYPERTIRSIRALRTTVREV